MKQKILLWYNFYIRKTLLRPQTKGAQHHTRSSRPNNSHLALKTVGLILSVAQCTQAYIYLVRLIMHQPISSAVPQCSSVAALHQIQGGAAKSMLHNPIGRCSALTHCITLTAQCCTSLKSVGGRRSISHTLGKNRDEDGQFAKIIKGEEARQK